MTFILEGTFEIDDYNTTSYMYECIAPMRALLLQKTAPTKYKKVLWIFSISQRVTFQNLHYLLIRLEIFILFQQILSLESHLKERKKSEDWIKKTTENVIGVMKKTLGRYIYE